MHERKTRTLPKGREEEEQRRVFMMKDCRLPLFDGQRAAFSTAHWERISGRINRLPAFVVYI